MKGEVDSVKASKGFWYVDELFEDEKVGTKKERKFEFETRLVSLNGLGSFIQILAWSLLAIVLVLMIYFMFQNFNFKSNNKKIGTSSVQSNIISKEDIFESNHINEVNSALKEKDFKRAIRWYFIWLLKELNNNDFIVFESHKTNYDYISELTIEDKVLDEDMAKIKECIKYYEYLWFGDFKIDSDGFYRIEKIFKSLIF
ncbi:hypothetical protein [uncultured Arcticibacterium sp.]|uniref:hypothetical protein n=1 Tax=uncultured Arcticibacterium sp. TaxID=2173042 RepID=UPI0030F6BD9F